MGRLRPRGLRWGAFGLGSSFMSYFKVFATPGWFLEVCQSKHVAVPFRGAERPVQACYELAVWKTSILPEGPQQMLRTLLPPLDARESCLVAMEGGTELKPRLQQPVPKPARASTTVGKKVLSSQHQPKTHTIVS